MGLNVYQFDMIDRRVRLNLGLVYEKGLGVGIESIKYNAGLA